MSDHHRSGGIAHGKAWQALREQAFTLHGRRCSECGKAGRLEVHHKVSLQHGGTNDLRNLEALCRGCHIERHRPQKGEQELAWQVLVGEIRGGRLP